MSKPESRIGRRSRLLSVLALGTALAVPLTGFAQPAPVDHSAHHPATAPADKPLADQVAELRAKVSKIEVAMQHRQMGMGGSTSGMQSMSGQGAGAGSAMPGMGAGSGAGGMGMMDNMMGKMGDGKQPMGQMQGMSGGGAMGMGMMKGTMGGEMSGMGMGSMGSVPGGGMSGMDQGMMGMMGMPPGRNMGGMAMSTALPGFPGASHLYHIGSSGFFLDHGEHITLSIEQQTALNRIKEKALLAKADAQRKIDAAEQELWTLTASDQPDAAKIQAKVEEIEKQRGDQRFNFIRAVGEAAKVLTDDQRKSLLGQLPPQNQSTRPSSGDTSIMKGM